MSLKGKKVCLTGALKMKRAEATKLITAAGGKCMSCVSSNTDIVVCGDSAGSKLDEAEALGVEVWDESDLLAALKKGGGKTKAPAAKKAPPAKKAKVVKKKATGGKKAFKGIKFCITGTLSMKRSEAVTKIINAGGEVVAKPSKNVDYLIVGSGAGSKESIAEGMGITTWDEDTFIDRLGGAPSESESESSEEESESSEEESESEEESSEDEKPAKGSGATASMWDTFVKGSMFKCMTVTAKGKKFPLRQDQKDELKKWVKGTWDNQWLVVKSGIPQYFRSSDGTPNHLTLVVKK